MSVKREVGASETEEQNDIKEQENFYFILCTCGFHERLIVEKGNDI